MLNMNEDAAWQRVLDIQREMQNSRQLAERSWPVMARLAERLGVWFGAVAALVRPVPRDEPLTDEHEPATDAA